MRQLTELRSEQGELSGILCGAGWDVNTYRVGSVEVKGLSCSLKCDGKFSVRCYIQNPFPECIFISYSKKKKVTFEDIYCLEGRPMCIFRFKIALSEEEKNSSDILFQYLRRNSTLYSNTRAFSINMYEA